jgi:hypothetical protein
LRALVEVRINIEVRTLAEMGNTANVWQMQAAKARLLMLYCTVIRYNNITTAVLTLIRLNKGIIQYHSPFTWSVISGLGNA